MGFLLASKETFNRRQRRNRDAEWSAIAETLAARAPGKFLDVGCGTGYALLKARALGFDVAGVDPEGGTYGVHDAATDEISSKIIKGVAERLPFENETFDVVYSSHAIEHFDDARAGLAEIARVLRSSGIAALVVPTGTAALLRAVSLYLFMMHRRIGKFLLRERSAAGLRSVFLPPPHGSEAGHALEELKTFSVARWSALFGEFFAIERVVLPCLYPWPDFPQFFPLIKSKRFASSVAFICRRKDALNANRN